VQDMWRDYVVTLWDPKIILAKRKLVKFVSTRHTREYAMNLLLVKETLQKIRASSVPCREWGELLGENRKSLEL
jgi:hypothetical protein